jgi:hypothetical protein
LLPIERSRSQENALNTIKPQNVTMRGTQMAFTAAALFAFQESYCDITEYKTSTKISAPLAMTAPVTMSLSAIADEVVDVKLALLEVNVTINDMTLTTHSC